ncbi:hypothetical protein [Streptomyces javensis]|uniref:Uncharacterized protein n=1 Tax=Streptomyces javensis TaxID=114698 RepID=A0ABS0RD40_9ACTN|nr:hypothetical protein [Streptomyces javensis]MBI0314746.1 hypothetical protein [Streptomyces javensis]
MTAVGTLERASPAPLPLATPEAYGHDQALDAMLYAVRRMGIQATDRQVATLLSVAERHLLPPETDEEPFPHGTMRGYRRHRRRREPACGPCREACRLESAARRKRSRVQKPCGTEAAYHRHLRRWEEPCQPCREAHRAYVRAYRKRRAHALAAA